MGIQSAILKDAEADTADFYMEHLWGGFSAHTNLKSNGNPTDANGCILLIQEVATDHDKIAKVFFDKGSTCVLIRNDFANDTNLKGMPVVIDLITVGGHTNTLQTNLFLVKLVDTEGLLMRCLLRY